jgi:hypothetical protein
MVNLLRSFFETNEIVFFFLYGQVFFIVGLAIASQSRQHSRLALTRSLPFLATFGIANGLAQWGHVFIPIQATYLPVTLVAALQFAQVSLLALSFAALMRFGLQLMTPEPVPQLWATWLPAGLLIVWEVTLIGSWLLRMAPDDVLLTNWEVVGHYVLAGPSARPHRARRPLRAGQRAELQFARTHHRRAHSGLPIHLRPDTSLQRDPGHGDFSD